MPHGPAQRRRVGKSPRPTPSEVRTLSAAETRRLLEAVRGDRLDPRATLYAGMRQGELLALKWQDVGLENDRLSVRRTITVSQGRILLGEPKTKT
jgi:integrase